MLKGSSLIPTALAGEKYNTCRKSNASVPSLCTCSPAAENLSFLFVCSLCGGGGFLFFFSPFFFFSLMSLCVVWKPQPETNPFLKEILLTVLQTCVL